MATRTYRYRLTKTEWFLAAFRWMRRKPLIFVNSVLAVVSVATAAIISTLLLTQAVHAHLPASAILLNLGLSGVMIFGFAGLAFFRLRREIRRSLQPDWGKEVTLRIEDDMLITTFPGIKENRYFWGAVRSLTETKQLGIIYFSRTICVAFPKRAVPAEAIARMNNSIADAKEAR